MTGGNCSQELPDYCRRPLQLAVAITLPAYAGQLFALTERNREFLGRWLPWLDDIRVPGDTLAFIHEQDRRRLRGESLHCTIFCQGLIAGVVAFNHIDPLSGTAVLGYWLGREFAGHGIMTRAARLLLAAGFADYGIRLVELTCASENIKSQRLAMRLGFQKTSPAGGIEEVARQSFYLAGPS